jgi:hypothetical protein
MDGAEESESEVSRRCRDLGGVLAADTTEILAESSVAYVMKAVLDPPMASV